MNFKPKYGILLNVMGFRGTHHPRFRLLCRLLAVFWCLTTLLGAVQPAVCALHSTAPLFNTSVSRAVLCRCPMCGHLHRVGMKRCCCPTGKSTKSGQMTLCAACPTGKDHTVAAFVWSEPALLPATETLTLPTQHLERFAMPASSPRLLRYDPIPRPPCLR